MNDDRGWTPERILAAAGTAALLLVLFVIMAMLVGGGDETEEEVAARPTPTPTPIPSPSPTPAPSPTPPPLTDEQRVQQETSIGIVRSQGYEPVALRRTYYGENELRLIFGRPQAAPQGGRRAFFFVETRLVGTDAPDPSAAVSMVKTTKTQVTLRYRLYAPGDSRDDPSGGTRRVRFKWDGQNLQVLDEIPPGTSRRPPENATT